MIEGNWVYSRSEYSAAHGAGYKTKEEAIAAAPEEWGTLYVGQLEKVELESPILADEIISIIGYGMGNCYWREDSDYTSDFVNSVSAEDEYRLQELLVS